MAKPRSECQFYINNNRARPEQLQPSKSDRQKVLTRRRIEAIEENKRINQEYEL